MTREEFMQHAADAAYLGDTSALRGYVGEVFDELERLREEVELHRDAGGYAFRGGYIEDASGGRWWSAGLLSMREAEIEMLRGVGCREAKEGEPESGPCGVCLRCAEERGAKWALDGVGWSRQDDRWSIAERICREAREKR